MDQDQVASRNQEPMESGGRAEAQGMARAGRQPGAYAFYGARVEGPLGQIPQVGDDRPSGSPRRMESTMNIPTARQVPVEGAVTGPDAPAVQLDAIRGRVDMDQLDDLTT